jgi:glycosyltransferase involved in cell wall biosynthesis/Tfp pilus assembly protein PilF
MILVGNSNIASFNQLGLEAATTHEPVEVHWVGALQIDHFLNGHPAGARVRTLFAGEQGWKLLSIGTHDVFGLCQQASQGNLETYLPVLLGLYRRIFTELRGSGKFGWLVFPQPLHQINFPGLTASDIFAVASRFNALVGEFCKEKNIPVIAPLPTLVDAHGEPRGQFVQRDGIHMNVDGMKIYLEKISSLTGIELRFSSQERPFEPASEAESFCSLLLDELRIPRTAPRADSADIVQSLTGHISDQLRERGIDLEIAADTELVASGLLDSLSLVETYTFATELLKMNIPFDVNLRELNTPSKIVALLLSRINAPEEGTPSSGGLRQEDFVLSLRGTSTDAEQKKHILEADRRIAAMPDSLFQAFLDHVSIVSHGVNIRYGIILFWVALNKATRGDYRDALKFLEAAADTQRAFPFLSPRIGEYRNDWLAKAAAAGKHKMLWELPVEESVLTVSSHLGDALKHEYLEIHERLRAGAKDEAVQKLEALIRKYPTHALLLNDLGVLYYAQGKKDEALSCYIKAVDLDPVNIAYLKNLADFYYVEQGNMEKALLLYMKALVQKPDDCETLLVIGQICLREGKVQDSKVFFEKVLAIDPQNAIAKEFLGALPSAQHQDESASEEEKHAAVVAECSSRMDSRADESDIEVLIRTDAESQKYLVTALVSTFNSERFIRGCLEDLEAQTIAKQIEIIVIDSCSQQNERAVVEEFQKRFSNIVYVRTRKREKLYAAWNRGIRMARGNYITNTNTDDRRLPEALETEARALDSFPTAGMVYADIWGTTVENDRLSPGNADRYHIYRYSEFTLLNGLTGSNFSPQPMWRKSCHDLVGYFDERYVIAGDYEFFYRLARRSGAVHIAAPLGLYLENPSGIEKSQPGLTKDEFRQLRKKFYSEISLDEFFPALSLFPGDAQARGSALFELGNNCLLASVYPEYELAESYYTQALSYLGQFPQLVHNLAIVQLALGAAAKGMDSLKSVEQILPASAKLLQALNRNGGKFESLAPDALQFFVSEHPVVKAARSGKSVSLEDVHRPREEAKHPGGNEKLVSILLYCSNEAIQLQECLESIKQHTPERHEIIVMADCLSGKALKSAKRIVREYANCRLVENRTKPNFASSCNQAIGSSTGAYILLLETPVRMADGWMSDLLECLESTPGSGIVGPVVSELQIAADTGHASMDHYDGEARAFRERNRHRRMAVKKIDPFCAVFRRSLFDRIGSLDENLAFADLSGEDFCVRSRLLGHENMVCGDVLLQCLGSSDTTGTAKGNRNTLLNKWSGIDPKSDLGRRLALINSLDQARLLRERGRPEAAVEFLVQTLKQFPSELNVYHQLIELLIDEKQYQHGMEIVQAMPQGVADAATALLAGYCKEGLDRLDEALADAERAVAADRRVGAAMNLKGVIAFKRDNRTAAEDFFRRAINEDPACGEPCTNLGVLLWSSGNREEGLNLLERGFVLSPEHNDANTLYYSAISESDAFPRAERAFREALALHPQNRRIAFLLIDSLLKQQRRREALERIEDAMLLHGIDDGILDAALAVRRQVGPSVAASGTSAERKTISLCMIVKNEQAHLARCLHSVRSLVDEMIVVDTGSTDRTRDIADIFGARLFEFPWTGDFSSARNYSLEQAACDWILVLDADEVVAHRDLALLRELAAGPRTIAYDFETRNYIFSVYIAGWRANKGDYPDEEAGSGWGSSVKVRMFPRDARIRFVNPVHELVEPSLHAAGYAIKSCPVPIHHYGKLSSEKDACKGEDYYELGKKKLQEKGEDFDAMRELAVQAGMLGKCDEAIELWHRVLRIQPNMIVAYVNLINVHLQKNDFPSALQTAQKAYAIEKNVREVVGAYALCEMYGGDIRRSVTALEDLAKRDKDYPFTTIMLLAAYYCSGAVEKGHALVDSLRLTGSAEFADAMEPFINKLILAGRPGYARRVIECLAEKKIEHEKLRNLLARCGEPASAAAS